MRLLAFSPVFLATFASAALAAAPPAQADWSAAARRDLDAMHDMLRDNHPAVLVQRDSRGFRGWLDTGWRAARSQAGLVSTEAGYGYLLKGYAGGFRDGHIWAYPVHMPQAPVLRWPGFSTAWRRGRYRVVYPGPSGAKPGPGRPPAGAALLSCDGKTAAEIARERLDRYEGDLTLESGRFYSAKSLLWDTGNPFAPVPRRCVFETPGGARSFTLRYEPPDADGMKQAGDLATAAPAASFDVAPWGARGWWIGIPSMTSDRDWPGFFAKLQAHRDDIRNGRLVVVDVRGNMGGDSSYADRLAQMLWGDTLVAARRPSLGPVVHRVGPLNRAQYEKLVKEAQADPDRANRVADLQAIVDRYEKAERDHRPLFTVEDETAAARPAPGANPLKGRVVILTDHACASACLDLMDLFLAMPNVEQAGTTTFADTIFMDTTTAKLPSGNAYLGFGHKAWIARPRGSGVAYSPRLTMTYTGDLADEAGLRRWLERATARP